MRLVEFGVFPTEAEIVMWQANCETIRHQIEMRMEKKMDELVQDETFAEILNTVVERMPRSSDIFRDAAFNSKSDYIDTKTSTIDMISQIVGKLLKNGWKNNDNFDKFVFLELITLLNEDQVDQLLPVIVKSMGFRKEDVDSYFEKFDKAIDEFIQYLKETKSEFEESEEKNSSASMIVELFVTIGSTVVDMKHLTTILENNSFKVPKTWVAKLPNLFEELYSLFDYTTLFDVASSLDAFPLRKLFQTKSFVCQSIVNTFVSMAPSTKFKTHDRIVQEMEKPTRFIGYAAELGYGDILKRFSPKFTIVVEEAKKKLEVETIERLRRCGYWKSFGKSNDQVVQQQIQSIIDVLPHVSPVLAQLALRHYSYITEDTLSNLLTREKLPLELLRVENLELDKMYSNEDVVDWPPLDFTASDEIEKSIYEERKAREAEKRRNDEAMRTGLFSLAPVNDPNIREAPSADDQKTELQKRAEAYKQEVMAKLRAIRNPEKNVMAPNDDDVLVPMANSKIYSALNNLKISDADKVSIRPTYEKYKYEIPNDDGMYDDEYDDGMEAREFNIERLNDELETSDDDEEEEEAGSSAQQSAPAQASRGGQRGGNSGGRGGRGRGGRGGGGGSNTTGGGGSDAGYTGGRDRQMKERHKSDHKQRGADRKKRGVY